MYNGFMEQDTSVKSESFLFFSEMLSLSKVTFSRSKTKYNTVVIWYATSNNHFNLNTLEQNTNSDGIKSNPSTK